MYQENLSYANAANFTNGNAISQMAVEQAPILHAIASEIRRLNNERWDLINSIQDRLHSIINLREPEKPSEQMPNDTSTFDKDMRFIIEMENYQNIALSKILQHLHKII